MRWVKLDAGDATGCCCWRAWPTIAAMRTVTGAFAAWHYRAGLAEARATRQKQLAVGNPLSLSAVATVGAPFAVVLLMVQLAEQHAPGLGVYVGAALAGAADLDAITLSMVVSCGSRTRVAPRV